ncbi:MAG TPA: MazG family protein [Streptosporangiaceae bacterium]|nr:MazG family protein [Streptosporangiaceae bacterium]
MLTPPGDRREVAPVSDRGEVAPVSDRGEATPDGNRGQAPVPAGSARDGAVVPGAALIELVAIMDRLRRECPWDARQTHESLAPFLLEETYEALEALERRDLAMLREELGDVLLQVLFHARVAAERTDGTAFTIDDVAEGIVGKLVRRHPHVFADVAVSGADEVKANWDAIKARERAEAQGGGPVSALAGVPMSQPALSLAAQLQRRAQRAGVPAALADLPVGDLPAAGLPAAGLPAAGLPVAGVPVAGVPVGDLVGAESVSAIGGELFALVARARAAGLDPELELRHAARVYRERVHEWERASADAGVESEAAEARAEGETEAADAEAEGESEAADAEAEGESEAAEAEAAEGETEDAAASTGGEDRGRRAD